MTAPAAATLFDAAFLRRLEAAGLLAKTLAGQFASPAPTHQPGPRPTRCLGDGLDLADHRPYVPGDDVRRIDWPAWGRLRRLLVRQFHQHRTGEVLVLLDTSASMAAGSGEAFDTARRAAAVLGYAAMATGQRIGIQPFAETPGSVIAAGADPACILPVLRRLESLEAGGRTDLLHCLRQSLPGWGAVGAVVLISDCADLGPQVDASARLLRSAGQGWQIAAVHVVRPDDATPSLQGDVRLRSAEGEGEMTLRVGPAERQRYRQWWAGHVERLSRAVGRIGGLYVQLRTDEPCERPLLRLLHRLGRVEA